MIVLHTDNFVRDLNELPTQVKKIFKKQEDIFVFNWKDTRLHTKKLKGASVFSFRVTRRYRVLFTLLDKDTAFFISIAHRKDIYE